MPELYNKIGDTLVSSDVETPLNFREAWILVSSNVITVDMEKAREIKKNELRKEREELFKYMDAEYIMALERGETAKKKKIAAQKQILRDFPEHSIFNEIDDPNVLENLTLDYFLNN